MLCKTIYILMNIFYINHAFSVNNESNILKGEVNEIIKFNSLTKEPYKQVCVLYPYQNEISNDELNSFKINTYISAVKYQSNEGHWSFIFIRDDLMKIATYKRSVNSDILAKHEINANVLGKIPLGFEPKNCVPFANAGVVKVVFNNRRYIIFGEIK